MKENLPEEEENNAEDVTLTTTPASLTTATIEPTTSTSTSNVDSLSSPPMDPPGVNASSLVTQHLIPSTGLAAALYSPSSSSSSSSSSQGTTTQAIAPSSLYTSSSLTSNLHQVSNDHPQHNPESNQGDPPKSKDTKLLGETYTSRSHHPTSTNSPNKLKLVPATAVPDPTGAYHGDSPRATMTLVNDDAGTTESGSTRIATVIAEPVDSIDNIHARENAELREQLRILQAQQEDPSTMIAQVVAVEDQEQQEEDGLEPPQDASYWNAVKTDDLSGDQQPDHEITRRRRLGFLVIALLLGVGIVAVVVIVLVGSSPSADDGTVNETSAFPSTAPTENVFSTSSPPTGPGDAVTTLPSTWTPSTMPSLLPTSIPSYIPSVSPSTVPTPNPTIVPTNFPSPEPTTPPVPDPTQSPTLSRRGFWLNLIAPTLDASTFPSALVWDAYLLDNPDTPQAQAIDWLTVVDEYTESYRSMDTEELMERYVFAVFYYSTSGPDWVASLPFLDPTTSVCEWNNGGEPDLFEYISDNPEYFEGVYCGYGDSPDGLATQLFLSYSEGKGTLPATELGLLERLLSFEVFSPTELTGPLPDVMPQSLEYLVLVYCFSTAGTTLPTTWRNTMPNLGYVFIPGNYFQGTIPTEWTGFPKLTSLSLSYNSLSGQIPSSLSSISSLNFLSVAFNSLSGTLPSELANLVSLEGLLVNNNFALGGTIPPEYLSWSNLGSFYAHLTNITGSFEMMCGGYDDSLVLVSNCQDGAVECSCCKVCCDPLATYCLIRY